MDAEEFFGEASSRRKLEYGDAATVCRRVFIWIRWPGGHE